MKPLRPTSFGGSSGGSSTSESLPPRTTPPLGPPMDDWQPAVSVVAASGFGGVAVAGRCVLGTLETPIGLSCPPPATRPFRVFAFRSGRSQNDLLELYIPREIERPVDLARKLLRDPHATRKSAVISFSVSNARSPQLAADASVSDSVGFTAFRQSELDGLTRWIHRSGLAGADGAIRSGDRLRPTGCGSRTDVFFVAAERRWRASRRNRRSAGDRLRIASAAPVRQVVQVFQLCDPHERQFQQHAAVHTLPHAGNRLVDDLHRGQQRLQTPSCCFGRRRSNSDGSVVQQQFGGTADVRRHHVSQTSQ